MEKRCPTCNTDLPVESFYVSSSTKDGRNWQCIECHSRRMKTMAERNAGRKELPAARGTKRCSTCKEEKPVSEFNRNKVAASGLCNVCKQCDKVYKSIRNERHKARNQQAMPVFASDAKKKCSKCKEMLPVGQFTKDIGRVDGLKAVCRNCSTTESKKWRSENLEKALFKSARHGAIKRGLEFSISVGDIHIPERCPVFGFELTLDGKRSTSASIDRIDNTKGYIPGNIVVVSMKANHVKSDCTIDELRRLVSFYDSLPK